MTGTASFREAANIAADSLRSSKMRSFLTLLGIILATTTLIAVMSMIHGMDVYIADNLSSMGTDGFRVVRMAFIGNFDPKKFALMQKRNPQLSADEFQFLKDHVTLVREIGMSVSRAVTVAYQGDSLDDITLTGASANDGILDNIEVTAGRFLTDTEDERHMPVAVIGPDIRDRFFAGVDPIDKIIKADGRQLKVVGVAKAKGSVFGQSQDGYVIIPVHTYFQYYSSRTGIRYVARALDRDTIERAEAEVSMLLRAYRHLRPKQDDTFSVISSDALLTAWDQLTGVIASTAVAIVSIFMVVGGVVIMNIMLAVVTERTREIGIRKSLGARRVDILYQFLVESSMLAAAGGLLGVIIAWAVAILVRNLTPVPMAVPPSSVLIGVGLSTVVGLFFGIYPAQRAAKMDPIEALRQER
jgi:putative ABC transport system permease protein